MRGKRGSRLKLIGDAEASAGVRAIFDEVRRNLGVPAVPVLYQAYAAVPRFLELHWEAFRPALQTRQFFCMGTRLAAEAYTRAQSYLEVPDVRGDGKGSLDESITQADKDGFARALNYYQYLDPLLLLITVSQMQAFDGPVGSDGKNDGPGDPRVFAAAPEPVSLEGAAATLHRIWDERRRALDLAFVPEEHRVFARWPAIYQRCWTALKGLITSPLYADCQYRIGESAWGMVRELPLQIETEIPRLLESGMNNEQVSAITRINELMIRTLTAQFLDVTLVRLACEGGSQVETHGYKPERATESGRSDVQVA